jgi:hypothetical protein
VRGKNICFLNSVGVLFVLLLGGCNQASIMKRFTSPQDESVARNYIDLVRQKQFDRVEKDMDPSLKDADLEDKLANLAATFPAQQPVSIKVVGMNYAGDTNSSTVNITLEYEFPDRWLLATVDMKKADGAATITGFHVSSMPDSLEHHNRFTLVGKSADQYAALFVGILEVLLSLYAFTECLRTKMGKAKWFWSVLCLVGVGQFGVNWTTGQSDWTLLAIRLPPAAATAPLYGAWVIYVTLPLGAVLFLGLKDRGYW